MKTGMMMFALMIATAISVGAQEPSRAAAASDTAFVAKLGEVGMAEVELGKLALQKTQRDDVKKFGQRMIDDHGKAGAELKAIALRKNISWPMELNAEHKALRERLSKLSGAAFDQAYIQAMVDGHRKVAAEVKTEVQSGSDAEVKAWAAKTLPRVEAHLEHAESVNRAVHPAGSTQ